MSSEPVTIIESGIRVVSDKGVVTVEWSELMRGHIMIRDGQSYQIGVHVGMHIAKMMASNDE